MPLMNCTPTPATKPFHETFMEQFPNSLWLTGSRFFGFHTNQSDWDFFAEYSTDCLNWLYDHGFIETGEPYNDANIATVLAKHNVHVQLVSDPQQRHEAQEWIKQNNLHYLINKRVASKEEIRTTWAIALRCHREPKVTIAMPKINAIKEIRTNTNLSLKEAKELVEKLVGHNNFW